jgi:hypothetical protein
MTDIADESTEVVQGAPPTVDGPTIKAGYLTTEFWQTNLVHLFSVVSSVLVFYNVNLSHLTAIQGLIPIASIAASLIAQLAYSNKRTAVKLHALTQWGEINAARVKADVTPLLPAIGMVAKAVDPAIYEEAKGTIDAAAKAWNEFPAPAEVTPDSSESVPVPDAEPTDATDVSSDEGTAPVEGDAAP